MALNIKPLFPYEHPEPLMETETQLASSSDQKGKEERESRKEPQYTMPYDIYKEVLLGMDPFFRARLKKLP